MGDPTGCSLADVATLIRRLEAARIHFTLNSIREGAVMVQVVVPGQPVEVEFFSDRMPEVEVFRSTGIIGDATLLERLFKAYGDGDPGSTCADTI